MRPPLLAAILFATFALCIPLAWGEINQKGNLRVSFNGQISPHALPRSGTAPIAVGVWGSITTTDGSQPPSLSRLEISINRAGQLDYAGLPVCSLAQIQPSTTASALAACRPALVGEGTFNASVAIPEQSPFPSEGRLLAFNGTQAGRPVIFAHVYGSEPVPTSFTVPIAISRMHGAYGILLSVSLPRVASNIAFVTGISLKLSRHFNYRGKARSYLAAGCPAPKGFGGASFSLVRSSFAFADGRRLSTTVQQSCKASE